MINNTYPESMEESKDVLKLTLQNISKYNLPYNPITYLIWYEYALGRNENLTRDIASLLAEKKIISTQVIDQLFKDHIADQKVVAAEEKARKFQKILVEMTKHLGQSGSEMDEKGEVLEDCALELSQASSMDTIAEITKRIVSETRSMAESTKILKGRLSSTASEIDKLSEELEEIKQAAKTDMLTGLLNRRGFDEAMIEILKDVKTKPEPLSFVMLDIDHFKRVNDTYGHLIGDNVLKILSKLLIDSIKGKDVAARFGGEEFILVLPQTPANGAHALSEQIRLSLERMKWKVKDTGTSLGTISISLGIALYREGEPIENTIKRADDALYHAKGTGRNRTVTEFDLEKVQ